MRGRFCLSGYMTLGISSVRFGLKRTSSAIEISLASCALREALSQGALIEEVLHHGFDALVRSQDYSRRAAGPARRNEAICQTENDFRFMPRVAIQWLSQRVTASRNMASLLAQYS